jgi:hypothetical protein
MLRLRTQPTADPSEEGEYVLCSAWRTRDVAQHSSLAALQGFENKASHARTGANNGEWGGRVRAYPHDDFPDGLLANGRNSLRSDE